MQPEDIEGWSSFLPLGPQLGHDILVELDVFTLEDARDAWRCGARDEVSQAEVQGMSLGAAFEAACWNATGDASVQYLLKAWSLRSSPLEQAIGGLAQRPLAQPEDHSSPTLELRRCPSAEELTDGAVGIEWQYFLERFRRSLSHHQSFDVSRSWQSDQSATPG